MPFLHDDPEEGRRLGDLYTLAVLDTPRDPNLDAHIQRARDISGATIAAVALTDGRRPWILARSEDDSDGMDDMLRLSADVLAGGGVVLRDGRAPGAPEQAGQVGLRFFCGIPLRTAEHHIVGVLMVADRRSRDLRPAQLLRLGALASVVGAQLERQVETALDAPTTTLTYETLIRASASGVDHARRQRQRAVAFAFELQALDEVGEWAGGANAAMRFAARAAYRHVTSHALLGRLPCGMGYAGLLFGIDEWRAHALCEQLTQVLAGGTDGFRLASRMAITALGLGDGPAAVLQRAVDGLATADTGCVVTV